MVALACAGCGGSRYASGWDGRRGYDGHGDYGYDLAAARAKARQYRAHAARSYPAPGTLDDPWGPYIREAAARFRVPETWVRAVMAQESGGNLYDADGRLVTSSAGAMGLMQVMPQTYDMLRLRLGLGSDPYEPHDNILAGAAYIREMYDRYGSPGFLAAYNAGPDRVDGSLSAGAALPPETVSYVASVVPRLGGPAPAGEGSYIRLTSATGASAADIAYAGGGMTGPEYHRLNDDRAYAGGGITGADYQATRETAAVAADDASLRAFDGGGLVTPGAPTGSTAGAGGWAVQVGAFPDPARSKAAVAEARSIGGMLLEGAEATITPVQRGGVLYRARLVGLSAGSAAAACARLSAGAMSCFAVPPEQ